MPPRCSHWGDVVWSWKLTVRASNEWCSCGATKNSAPSAHWPQESLAEVGIMEEVQTRKLCFRQRIQTCSHTEEPPIKVGS